MKKIILAASLIIAATSITGTISANATPSVVLSKGDGKHISAAEVPAPVMASFNSNFPNAANVQWEKEKEHGQTTYQAKFLQNGKKKVAVFAANGTLLSSK